MERDLTSSNMNNYMIDCNTCNTQNFGITTPPLLTLYAKAYCLTANGYPSVDGFTHRTYVMECEDAESERSGRG